MKTTDLLISRLQTIAKYSEGIFLAGQLFMWDQDEIEEPKKFKASFQNLRRKNPHWFNVRFDFGSGHRVYQLSKRFYDKYDIEWLSCYRNPDATMCLHAILWTAFSVIILRQTSGVFRNPVIFYEDLDILFDRFDGAVTRFKPDGVITIPARIHLYEKSEEVFSVPGNLSYGRMLHIVQKLYEKTGYDVSAFADYEGARVSERMVVRKGFIPKSDAGLHADLREYVGVSGMISGADKFAMDCQMYQAGCFVHPKYRFGVYS